MSIKGMMYVLNKSDNESPPRRGAQVAYRNSNTVNITPLIDVWRRRWAEERRIWVPTMAR